MTPGVFRRALPGALIGLLSLVFVGAIGCGGGGSKGGSGAGTGANPTPSVQGRFVPTTGSMSCARWDPAAALLGSGEVLIVGGIGNPGSADLYNPNTGSFSTVGTVPNMYRPVATATTLGNGKVLVTFSLVSDAYLYDPQTRSFTYSATMNAGGGRDGHSATLLKNGWVLLAGGLPSWDAHSASAELYDPATETFLQTWNGMAETHRSGHVAVRLSDGKVLLAGGMNPGVLASAELYDPLQDNFEPVGNLLEATAVDGISGALLANGKVLVVGGGKSSNQAELYDPATKAFTRTGAMHQQSAYLRVVPFLGGQKALVVGAAVGVQVQGAEVYDVATGTFTNAGNMNAVRTWPSLTLLNNGRVLVAGGAGLASAELFEY